MIPRFIKHNLDHTKCDPMFSCPQVSLIEDSIPSITAMKKNFHKIYESSKAEENHSKSSNSVRIATYNVHYWTDLYEKPSFDKILKDIAIINADILCLQEVSFDRTKFNPYNYDQLMGKFRDMGYCDYVEVYGSQYLGSRFGNLILSRCKMDNKLWGTLHKGNVKVRRGYCLASFKDLNVDVCCVHLDVFDESGDTRRKQLEEMLKLVSAPRENLIICGDFNSIRKQDYEPKRLNTIINHDHLRGIVTDTQTLQKLDELNYKTSFEHAQKKSDCTVWSCRAIDHIFLHSNCPYKIVKSEVHYTINSDHFAIYADINKLV